MADAPERPKAPASRRDVHLISVEGETVFRNLAGDMTWSSGVLKEQIVQLQRAEDTAVDSNRRKHPSKRSEASITACLKVYARPRVNAQYFPFRQTVTTKPAAKSAMHTHSYTKKVETPRLLLNISYGVRVLCMWGLHCCQCLCRC